MILLRFPGNARMSRAALSVCAVLCALSTFQCLEQPLEPIAPSWDLRVTLPLANRTHSLSEIVARDTSMLRAGAGGLISYAATLQTPATVVGDLISVRPPDTTAVIRFGTFAVSTPAMTVPLLLPWLPGGAMVPLPDTTVQFPALLEDIPTFESVTFAEGTIRLTVNNNLPVPVDVPGPVTLTDNLGRTVAVFTFSPPAVPANGSRTAVDNLADRSTAHQLTLSGLALHITGSVSPVQIPVGDLFALTLSTSQARARSAVFADIPPQRLADNDSTSIRLDDSTLVKELRFAAGSMHFSFVNHIDLDMLFKFRFRDMYRGAGAARVAYEDSIILPAGGSGNLDLPLAGCSIQSVDGNLLQSLETVTSVILPTGSGRRVTVNDTDRVEIRVTTLAPLLVDTAVGVIKPTWLNVNVPVAVNFGELPTRFSGQLNIPAAGLGLSTAISFGFPMDLYVVIGARTTPHGGWVYLSVPATQKRVPPGASSVQFDATEVGDFFSAFSGRLPDTLFVVGQVLVNPPEAYTPTLAGAGGIGRRSSFQGAVSLDIPLTLGIANGSYSDTLSLGDTTGDGAADFTVDRSRLRDIQNGTMYVEIENGLPLSVNMEVQLLDGTNLPLLAVPRAGETVGAASATVDAQGTVTAPASGRSVVVLQTRDVRQFDVARRMAYRLSFATPPAAGAVRFRLSDYVHVRIWTSFSYRVRG
jgi:hypothetical protein